MDLLSTAMHIGPTIDCRCLSIMAEFYELSREEALQLAQDVIVWSEKFYGKDFIAKRTVGRQIISLKGLLAKLDNELQPGCGLSYIEEAMVKSPVVYNGMTFRKYLHQIRWGVSCGSMHVSADYCDYWNRLFSDLPLDDDAIRQRIYRIFQEKNKQNIASYHLTDTQAGLIINPYRNFPNCYYGCYDFSISAYCLQGHIEDAADRLKSFAEFLSSKYQKINVRVMLQPIVGPDRNPYMTIFGRYGMVDGSHEEANCTEQEWYPTYYVPGVEWFNILSPKASAHLDLNSCNETTDMATIQTTSNGATVIASRNTITQYDVPDAIALKQLTLPALYPGRSYLKLKGLMNNQITCQTLGVFPRSNWAIIPVLEEEIDVFSGYLVFTANGE